jgi:hypothetical protein
MALCCIAALLFPYWVLCLLKVIATNLISLRAELMDDGKKLIVEFTRGILCLTLKLNELFFVVGEFELF